jgi:BMFP domain-containing protein YqiC
MNPEFLHRERAVSGRRGTISVRRAGFGRHRSRAKVIGMNTRLIDELTRKLSQALPEGTGAFQQDVEKNIRATLQGAFRKMDLVTREEFEVQQALLARSREKLERLEAEIRALESRLEGK